MSYESGASCFGAFYVGDMSLGKYYVGRGCSAPIQLMLGLQYLRDKSSTASNPRSSQHSPANKLEDI